ncbi:unnamed protein product [Danaus chrysippus]|uniref:(African queen) hypothetical protein n=1 Tax=Danaus chrysippus TaxID=151541 RepID=A0A8J2R6W2_9NEOP|nr:unnamed protein product [Danaus chrysippus]
MIRLSQRNFLFSHGKCLINKAFVHDVFSNTKITNLSHRNLVRHFASKQKEEEKLERIYYGPLTPQIRAVKIFSVSSSAAGLAAQPIIIRESSSIGSTSLIVALCSVVGFFTFVTPILLHFITKKYVTEMHYNPETDTYRATTLNFFIAPVYHHFKTDDVVVPDIPGMFTTMVAKGKPLFIEARHFSDPLYYAKIMGYDKPLDFKLGEPQDNENKTS